MELLERRAGFDRQFVDEGAPQPGEGLQCVGLPAGAVERHHQVGVELLAHREFGGERLEFADEVVVAAQLQVGPDALFECRRAQFAEADRGTVEQRPVGGVGQQGSAPQRERAALEVGGGRGVVAGHGGAAPGVQVLEGGQVEPVRVQAHEVAGRAGDQGFAARVGVGGVQEFAQLRDVDLERGRRGARRVLAPQFVDEAAHGHDLVGPYQQRREDHADLRRPGRHAARVRAGRVHFQWPQHPKSHAAPVPRYSGGTGGGRLPQLPGPRHPRAGPTPASDSGTPDPGPRTRARDPQATL